MSISPKISIICSSYNSGNTLEKSIGSLLNQSFRDFELILIDDFSSDNSREIIKKFEKGDKRIIAMYNEINLGISKTKNKALKIARGKYIAILDSDDFANVDRLKIQFDYLEKNKNIFLIGSSVNKVINGDKIYTLKRLNLPFFMINLCLVFGKVIFTHSTIMFRNNNNFFYNENKSLAVDYDFYLNLLFKKKKMKNISDVLVDYTYISTSESLTKPFLQELECILSRNRFILGKILKIKNFENSKFVDLDYLRKKYRKTELKLIIRNNYRLGDICLGNENLLIYIKKYKTIPIKFFILFVLHKFNSNLIRRI